MPLTEVIAETGVDVGLPKLPSFSLSSNMVGICAVIFITLIILAFISYFIFMWLRYNQHIVVWGQSGRDVLPIARDKGWFQRIGHTGDVWCRTKKLKRVLERPSVKTGREYWFFKRADGELINFGLKDFDESMRSAGANYIHEDMRLSRVAIGKMLQQEYKKEGFLEKYGSYIAIGVLCIIVIVGSVLNTQQNLKYAEKMGQLQESANTIFQSSVTMANAVKDMADKMGGSAKVVTPVKATSGGV